MSSQGSFDGGDLNNNKDDTKTVFNNNNDDDDEYLTEDEFGMDPGLQVVCRYCLTENNTAISDSCTACNQLLLPDLDDPNLTYDIMYDIDRSNVSRTLSEQINDKKHKSTKSEVEVKKPQKDNIFTYSKPIIWNNGNIRVKVVEDASERIMDHLFSERIYFAVRIIFTKLDDSELLGYWQVARGVNDFEELDDILKYENEHFLNAKAIKYLPNIPGSNGNKEEKKVKKKTGGILGVFRRRSINGKTDLGPVNDNRTRAVSNGGNIKSIPKSSIKDAETAFDNYLKTTFEIIGKYNKKDKHHNNNIFNLKAFDGFFDITNADDTYELSMLSSVNY